MENHLSSCRMRLPIISNKFQAPQIFSKLVLFLHPQQSDADVMGHQCGDSLYLSLFLLPL
jgi:hypothetical protein